MSLNYVRQILLRCATDADYRSRFFSEQRPELLRQYRLTDEERTCLMGLTEDRLGTEATKLNNCVAVSDIRV